MKSPKSELGDRFIPASLGFRALLVEGFEVSAKPPKAANAPRLWHGAWLPGPKELRVQSKVSLTSQQTP